MRISDFGFRISDLAMLFRNGREGRKGSKGCGFLPATHPSRFRSFAFLFASFAAVLLPVLLAAAPAMGAPEAKDAREEYRVQAGDTLEVHVWNEGDQAREFTVDAQGNVSYPAVGMVSVKGMSLREITDRIVEELKKQIKNPRVTVTVKAFAPPAAPPPALAKRVFVMGAVAKPGPYELIAGMRVVDAIAQAGGLAPNAAGARATLSSAKRGKLPVDLEKLLGEGEMGQNLPLEEDDLILVPARDEKATSLGVVIVGQVPRPGMHRLPLGSRLSDAMAACGGTAITADMRGATLTRAGLSVKVDLDAIFRKGDLAGDLPLREGDVLLIPEQGRREICLLGQFQKRGFCEFREGATLLDAVALGGGPTQDADLRGAILKRGGKEIPVDLFAMLELGDTAQNQALQAGDELVVPAAMRIYALGAVGKPGPLSIPRSAKVIDVLFQAGGADPRARLDRAGVVRIVEEKAKVLPLDIKDATQKGGPDRDFQFAAGDVLFIPTKPHAYSWQGMLGTATSVASALWLLGAIDRR